MVSDETVVDLKTTANLLDYSRNPDLKALLDKYDVVDIEVRTFGIDKQEYFYLSRRKRCELTNRLNVEPIRVTSSEKG